MSIHERLGNSFEVIKNKIENGEKAGIVDLVESSSIYGDKLTPRLNKKEYLRASVGWVYGAVSVIADEIGGIQLRLKKYSPDGTSKEVVDHPAIDLIYHANNATTRFDLMSLTVNYLELTGEAPWFISFKNGRPSSILLLRPDKLTVKKGKDENLIAGYSYNVDGKEIELDPWEVVPLRYTDPDNPLRGKGPLQAAATSFDLDNYAERWNSQFFKNAAVPDSILQTDKLLTKEVRNALEQKLKAKYKGIDNSSKTMILEGGLKWQPMSVSQRDMQFLGQQTFSRDKILAIFRVPRTALGITDDVNRANAEATDYVFAKRTIKPKMIRIVEQLNEFLLPLFSNSDALYFDFDDPVPQNVDQQIAKANAGVQNGYMTINEAREINGLDPIEGGDILRDPNSFSPVQDPFGDMEEGQEMAYIKRSKKKGDPKAPVQAVHRYAQRTRKSKEEAAQKEIIANEIQKAVVPVIFRMLKAKVPSELAKKRAGQVAKSPLLTATPENLRKVKYDFQEKQLNVASKYEEQVKDKMAAIFRKQEEVAKRQIEGSDKPSLDPQIEAERTQKALKATMIAMMREQADLAFQILGVHDAFGDQKAALTFLQTLTSYFERRTFKFATDVTRETNKKLQDQFREGTKKGESIAQLKKRVGALFEQMAVYRAERIARTETILGSNFSTEAAYKDSGVVEGKEWLTTRDERTDDECAELDGKIVALDGKFFKGDYFNGQYPPIHANCRCTIIPVIIRE